MKHKKLLTGAMRDMEALDGRQGKVLSQQGLREAVTAMVEKIKLCERRACRHVGLSRSVLHCESKLDYPMNTCMRGSSNGRMLTIGSCIPSFSEKAFTPITGEYIDCIVQLAWPYGHVPARRDGGAWQLVLSIAANEVWSIDFVMDALCKTKYLTCLTIVDYFTNSSVDIVVDHSISGLYLARVLEQAARFPDYPKAVRTDQKPQYTSRVLDQWVTPAA